MDFEERASVDTEEFWPLQVAAVGMTRVALFSLKHRPVRMRHAWSNIAQRPESQRARSIVCGPEHRLAPSTLLALSDTPQLLHRCYRFIEVGRSRMWCSGPLLLAKSNYLLQHPALPMEARQIDSIQGCSTLPVSSVGAVVCWRALARRALERPPPPDPALGFLLDQSSMSDGTPSLNAAATFVGPASGGFYVAALVVEIVLFGAFVGTFAYGSWLILFRAHPSARRQTSTVVLFVANTMMLILTLVHLALDIEVARRGFLHAPKAMEEAKFVLYVSQTLIGDGFMIYRLFRVYSRHWPVIVVPSFLLLADAVVGYACAFLGVAGFYMSVVFYAISLILNVICTVCIMLKVFRITRDFHGVYLQGHKLKLWKVLEATVQSTAIYSAAAVSLVITFVNSTDIGYPTCLNVFPALIGLVFSFIAIRIASNLARDDSRADSNFQLTDSTGGAGAGARSRQTASSATYVERDGDGRPSILQVLGSDKEKDKLGEDGAVDVSNSKDKSSSPSASASVESLVFAPISLNRLEEGGRGVRVLQGEAA